MNSSKIQPNKNYSGVLIGQQKTDWLLGANSPLGLKVRLEDKNWKSYTSHEIKFIRYLYSFACFNSLI